MKQRGFGWIEVVIVLAAAAALISAVWGGLAWHASVHFKRGQADVQAKWDRQKLDDIAAGAARDHDVSDVIKEAHAKAAAAAARAEENDQKWKEAQREARRDGKPLGSCTEPGPDSRTVVATGGVAGESAGSGVVPPGRARGGAVIRLHWRFVGLHDGAFTGVDGEPVFKAGAEFAAAPERADTASPYGLDELADVQGENARSYSACLRWVDDALKKIQAAGAAWERGGDRDARERAAAP